MTPPKPTLKVQRWDVKKGSFDVILDKSDNGVIVLFSSLAAIAAIVEAVVRWERSRPAERFPIGSLDPKVIEMEAAEQNLMEQVRAARAAGVIQ